MSIEDGRAERARARMRRWRADPIAFVREEMQAEPDPWQAEALAALPHVNRLALKACKGPGKTAFLAWAILWFLVTRSHPRIGCVSITGANLASNLWPELALWIEKSPFCRNTFTWTKSAVVHKWHPATWWAQARSWAKQADSERQADALAGLHAKSAMAVLDESGGIPQSVMTTAEAVLATGGDVKVLQAGNPTHTTGPLHRACTVDRALWKLIQITGDPDDPKRSTRIDLKWAKQQIKSYGRDNPWVMVNVLGQFPPASINALLGIEEVEAAMRRHIRPDAFTHQQKRLGIDVARFGDDRTVIFPRQGLASFRPVVMRNANTVQIAGRVMRGMNQWEGCELALVDDTGHWGHGVIDTLITAGYPVIGINYAGKANDPRYKNKRAEMWIEGAKAIRSGAALPLIPSMVPEFTEPTYMFHNGVFVLEEKEQIKARIGSSPDYADAYMTSYGIPELPSEMAQRLGKRNKVKTQFDPYTERRDVGEYRGDDEPHGGSRVITEFDPYEGQ